MKKIKWISFSLMLLTAMVFTACGGEATAHGEGKEYTSAYVCPMHCKDSGSDAAGKCPVCGMDYVAQASHVEDGHTHEQ